MIAAKASPFVPAPVMFLCAAVACVTACSAPVASPESAHIVSSDGDPPEACVELGLVSGSASFGLGSRHSGSAEREEESKTSARNAAAQMQADFVRWELLTDYGSKVVGTAFRCDSAKAPAPSEPTGVRLVRTTALPRCDELGALTSEGQQGSGRPSPATELEVARADMRMQAQRKGATHVRYDVRRHGGPSLAAVLESGSMPDVRTGYFLVGTAFRCDVAI
jgi:hypothetical protein